MENKSKGISLILLSALFFSLMAVTVKSLPHIPTAEKIFFRNLLGLAVASYMIVKKGKTFTGNNKKLLVLRSTFGLLGVATYFYALNADGMLLANSVILNKMSPFFVMVMSFIFLGEHIKRHQIIALLLAISGAILVTRPTLDISVVPSLFALGSAFFAGCAYTTIRHLRHTDSSETIVFYFTLFSTIAMIPFMLAGQFVIPDFFTFLRLILLGAFATIAQFCMTNAYRYAPAGELSIYTYVNIVFSSIFGLLIWSEVPDFITILGGVLIITAGYVNYKVGKMK